MFESFRFRRPFFSTPKRNPFAEKEAGVRADLAPFFNDYEFWFGQLHNRVFDALETYATHAEAQRPVGKLEMVLLARLLGDLRVCQRTACDGYPMQALTVASSAHEIAFGIIYLGDSEVRCREWTEHSNKRKQYPECGHHDVVRSVKDVLGMSAGDAEKEFDIYRELCWGKHGNPILQRSYGTLVAGDLAQVQQQPYFSEQTVRIGRYALLQACRVVTYATRVFVDLHLPTVEQARFVSTLGVIEAQINMLGVRDKLAT